MADCHTSPTSVHSILSNITVHTEKEPASRGSSTASPPTSTPPTSLGDEASILSEVSKMEQLVEIHEEASSSLVPDTAAAALQPAPEPPNSEGRRSARSSRKSVVTYNVQILAGTAIHTPSKYLDKHHKNVLHGPLEIVAKPSPTSSPKRRVSRIKAGTADSDDPAEQQLATEAAQAAQRRVLRPTDLRREAIRNLSGVGEAVAHTLSGGKELVKSVLKRSASDSRLRSSLKTAMTSNKRPRTVRAADSDDEEEEEKSFAKPKTKQWLRQGLFVGQYRDFNPRFSEAQNRARRKSRPSKESTILPLPMFTTGDMLHNKDLRTHERNFKLPYDVYNPLPRKVKVDGWVKLHRNRFIGDASALWKRDKQDTSQCYCDEEDGCGEACHNRIMAYECDETNCPLAADQCGNRPFAQLKKRAKGNGYDYGVEVMQTDDKGYGVRAMRSFEPHQIIVEYAGEIITQNECERRMKQVYKKDKCYYLMSFDNKMIIDATRGTIARFVNHSCEPNCEMIKWTVRGEPRMALFAGRRGIMTGEELTYDYNFDPFSTKNIQECHCGTESCRGVLGPKPKKPANEERSIASTIFAGTKRKLQEVFGAGRGSGSAPNSPKKRLTSNSAMTKARNAMAQSEAARSQAKRDAAAHAAQLASREDRALKRQKALSLSKRAAALRRGLSKSKPVLKSSRHATFSLQRKVPRPGALKPVKRMPTALRRSVPAAKPKKGARATGDPKETLRSSTPESESSDDESPNITPASLRSASKKLAQSKGTVKSLRFGKESSNSHDSENESVISDSEGIGMEYATSKLKGRKRGSAPAPRGIHKTGSGVTKTGRRVRDSRGVFATRG